MQQKGNEAGKRSVSLGNPGQVAVHSCICTVNLAGANLSPTRRRRPVHEEPTAFRRGLRVLSTDLVFSVSSSVCAYCGQHVDVCVKGRKSCRVIPHIV